METTDPPAPKVAPGTASNRDGVDRSAEGGSDVGAKAVGGEVSASRSIVALAGSGAACTALAAKMAAAAMLPKTPPR